MPPQRKPSWWEHVDLELRLYRSGGFFFLSGHDGTKRVHERLTKNASSEKILSKSRCPRATQQTSWPPSIALSVCQIFVLRDPALHVLLLDGSRSLLAS